MESKPLELPKEWVEKIKRDALQKANDMHYYADGNDDILATYEAAAMTYAPWLYTCQTNYAALQSKCDRYEKALKAAQIQAIEVQENHFQLMCPNPLNLINEALNGVGEEVPDEGKIMVCNNSDAFRYWTANIKGYRIAHKGHITEIWLPKGMTSEIFSKEWDEYEHGNNPKYQKEDK